MEDARREFFRALSKRDHRFSVEAYFFMDELVAYAQGRRFTPQQIRDNEAHVAPSDLVDDFELYTIEQYGMMAEVVLASFGMENWCHFAEVLRNLRDSEYFEFRNIDGLASLQDRGEFTGLQNISVIEIADQGVRYGFKV